MSKKPLTRKQPDHHLQFSQPFWDFPRHPGILHHKKVVLKCVPFLAIKTKIKQVRDKEFPTLSLYDAYVALVRGGQLPPPSIDWHHDDPLGLKNPPKLGDIPEHSYE